MFHPVSKFFNLFGVSVTSGFLTGPFSNTNHIIVHTVAVANRLKGDISGRPMLLLTWVVLNYEKDG
jgi:hypothetical protein